MAVTMKSKIRLSVSRKEDRISQLPDSLLHHILSFLNAIDVVRTSFLCKRWRYLWTSVPSLEFSDQIINTGIAGSKSLFFTNFINQFLLRREFSPIDKFIIRSYLNVKAIAVESFIGYAMKLGVKQLDIDCFFSTQEDLRVGPMKSSPRFFSCNSLTTLKLNFHGGIFTIPTSLGLPSLKTLHLIYFGNFDGNVFSTCPNLETLILEDLFLYGIKSFNINAPNLKSLVLDISETDDPMFMISAPKLTKFKFTTGQLVVFSINNLNSLDEVDFDLIFEFNQDETDDEFCLNLVNMLNEFHNAKSITLSWDTFEVLSMFPDTLNEHPSQFSNLKYLKLGRTWRKHVSLPGCVLAYFLKNSPSLKVCLQNF
ncbi:hypothetical protein JCGZ_12748 [Jatropha curcas]|uniref:F-box domain-containing protein n=1 Tax=Jatropha curcas TaxID=180498 RepID=A0A067KAJ7_JATCU|nr:F-box/LRR-repeat protein At4g14103 [Jatropha curcas]KDP33226.1 hypothetical protein JCGZ_12748 [Jatropha curcas]